MVDVFVFQSYNKNGAFTILLLMNDFLSA